MAKEVQRIAVLGAGNMGSELIGGILKAGVARPEQVVATTQSEERAAEVSGKYGVRATPVAANDAATAEDKELVARIFRAVGVVVQVEEEAMDAVTALSGSGSAYIYMVIEAMIAGGLKMGLSHEVATRLAEQTVLGAAKLVRETGAHPAILRDQVITPGGVTISAIHELERHGLRAMLISALETATNHSRSRTRMMLGGGK